MPTVQRPTRAQQRQAERALGFRGTKAKRHTFVRRIREVREVVAINDALSSAQEMNSDL